MEADQLDLIDILLVFETAHTEFETVPCDVLSGLDVGSCECDGLEVFDLERPEPLEVTLGLRT
jgi:hypothetical protein